MTERGAKRYDGGSAKFAIQATLIMLVFNYSPKQQSWEFEDLYERSAREGMVHSALMCGEHFDMADDFSDDYAIDAVTWSCGGYETYQLSSKKSISIAPAGVLTLAAGERYSYDASCDTPFRSNMISFPNWMTQSDDAETEIWNFQPARTHLATRFCRPSTQTFALMNAIAGRCAAGADDAMWYTEHTALLYARLLQEQASNGASNIPAIKLATRKELAHRVERSSQLILQAYRDPALSLDDMARAACVSRFHFIRIFKDTKGVTPMQYLAAIRMDAGMRLLRSCKLTISEIADAVGYIDRAAFARSFKRHYGIAPSVIRGHAF